jgi:chromosome segregation ATPase
LLQEINGLKYHIDELQGESNNQQRQYRLLESNHYSSRSEKEELKERIRQLETQVQQSQEIPSKQTKGYDQKVTKLKDKLRQANKQIMKLLN